MAQIFVIDPRPNVINLSRSVLGGRGHKVRTFQNFDVSLQSIEADKPDVVVISPEGSPRIHVEELVACIYNAHRDAIVILLISNTEEEQNLVVALEAGAADVVLMPFIPAELAGRIAAAIRVQSRRLAKRRWSSDAIKRNPAARKRIQQPAIGIKQNPRSSNRLQANRIRPPTRGLNKAAGFSKSSVVIKDPIPDVLANGELSGVGVLKLALVKDDRKIKGRIFDSYRLEKILGVGGMGVVIQAIHRETGRPMALKILRSDIEGDPEAPKRFLREAYVLLGINHKNIVSLEDIGRAGGTSFYAMEYVEGLTLADLLDQKTRLPIAHACQIAAGLAWALSALAKKQLVHRDIKPGNIFLSPNLQKIKLGDFGLAKRARARDVTPRKSLIGTPHYIAPEVIAGEPATNQSDIYSLGVCFHEMLCGQTLHNEEPTAALLYKIVNGDPPILNETLKNVPGPVRQAVEIATQRYPEQRYPDSATFAHELDRLRQRYSRRPKAQGIRPHG
jgi:DNA-binding response OmpR family regulator